MAVLTGSDVKGLDVAYLGAPLYLLGDPGFPDSTTLDIAYLGAPLYAVKSGSLTLACTTNAISITSIAANLKAGRKIIATSSNIVYTTNPTDLKISRKITADSSNISFSGNTTGILLGRKVQAAVSTLSLGSPSVTLRMARKIIASVSAITLTAINVNTRVGHAGDPFIYGSLVRTIMLRADTKSAVLMATTKHHMTESESWANILASRPTNLLIH